MKAYLQHAKTKKRYEIVSVDKAQGTIRLRGEHGEFDEKYDKDRFKRLGYSMVREDAA